MKAISCHSTNMDPYQAGIEIGEQLASIHPEVIFLFSSIHYEGSPELLSAIYDVLDSENTILIGCTGDGFYEHDKVANAGVSAVGIHSNGAVRWHLAYESGVGENPQQATQCCMEKLAVACGSRAPDFYFMTTDFRSDSSEIITALRKLTSLPVVGGAGADDFLLKSCFTYANQQVLTDCIVMLAVEGDLSYEIRIAQEMPLVGVAGKITEGSGLMVSTIDHIPAIDFIEKQLGKPLNTVDAGVVTLKIMGDQEQELRLRSLLMPDEKDPSGKIEFFGGVEQGATAKVCLASPDKIVKDISDIAGTLSDLPFKPVAGLIVSCAGRKKVLGDKIDLEVKELIQGYPALTAIAGFPSFGEFGPVKEGDGYSRPLFHNMTYILLLIGPGQK